MHRFADILFTPLLDALRPQVIVEVGAGRGRLTRVLLKRAAQAAVHAVDPVPTLDATTLGRAHPGRLFVHRALGVEAIGAVGDIDLAIIDGDPNYSTVYAELQSIADPSAGGPVVVVHHTQWPFARRDGYYDPARIGGDALNSPTASGVRPGHVGVSDAGLRLVPYVAAADTGPRNGVRRALDDFGFAHPGWTQVDVPGLHGVCILCPPERLRAQPELGPVFARFAGAPFLGEVVRLLERERIAATGEHGLDLRDPAAETPTTLP